MTVTWLAAALALMTLASTAVGSERQAQQRIALAGRQAPVPFELGIDLAALSPTARYAGRGVILAAGRPVWAAGSQAIDTSAHVADSGPIVIQQSTGPLRATTLRCGDLVIQAAFMGDRARLAVDGHEFALTQVAAASGALYVADIEARTTFWSKGERATLVLRGIEYPECVPLPEPGRIFRASGNEPGWTLVVDEAGLELTTRYGEQRFRASRVTIDSSAGRSIYRAEADGQAVTVTVTDRLCTDTMSGMQRPLTVEVEMTGERLTGCGGEASSLLVGPEWAVVSLDGQAVEPGSAPSLEFDSDGNLFGKGSCNRYRGPFKLTGETLTMGPLATTMMACDPPLMDQEERFLALLAEVRGFEIGTDGELTLRTGDGRAILARRG
jgi:heat shock protein HslJ/membrane-bound inhibitor of C-type lysozyme